MQFMFLGTASGTPTKSRNVSGIALKKENRKEWFLIDCGEGTQHQLLRTPYSLHHLSAILITHVHGDHCFGLPGLLASAALNGRKERLSIIAPENIQQLIMAVVKHCELYLSFELEFIDVSTMKTPWVSNGIMIDPFTLSHRTPSFAFRFTEQPAQKRLLHEKLKREGVAPGPTWGKLQRGEDVILDGGKILKGNDYLEWNDKPGRIIVAGDNDTPQLLQEACSDCDVLIHEATYTEELAKKIGVSHQHSSAARVAQFAESVQLPSLVLTHFSARYQEKQGHSPSLDDLKNEAKTYYQGNLFLANDLEQFTLDRKGVLSRD